MTTVFIDFETSGLKPDQHEIVQAGIVVVDDNFQHLKSFDWPEVAFDITKAEKEALEVNKYVGFQNPITQEQLCLELNKVLQEYAVHEKVSKKGNPYYVAKLGGHNVGNFDVLFLDALFKRFGLYCPIDYHYVDTVPMAMAYFHKRASKPKSVKLTALGEFFGFPVEGAHGALFDADLSAKLAGIFLGAAFKTEHEVTPTGHRLIVNEDSTPFVPHDQSLFIMHLGKVFFAPAIGNKDFENYKVYEVIAQ
jgi:DNA polymerase III epsilon subunit-like protein